MKQVKIICSTNSRALQAKCNKILPMLREAQIFIAYHMPMWIASIVHETTEEEKLNDILIEEMDVSPRVKNALIAAEVGSLSELYGLSIMELMKFRNFGKGSIEELNIYLTRRGMEPLS